ncbi:MAG: hypothetical protein CL609_05015 [Anaerolineaceae bacterium]|nr:hypothetical protein [Anaerolineaceae bacterium]
MASKKRSLFHRKSTLFRIGIFLLILVMVPVGIVLADGEAGFALSFDGIDDYVVLDETNTVMGGTSWKDTKTVSMWIKPEGSSSACDIDAVRCDAVFGDRARWWGFSRGILNSQDRIWLFNYDGNIDQIGVQYTIGEWMHIAFVHSGGVLYAYKNGVLVGSVNSGTTQSPDTGAIPVLYIGGMIVGPNNWLYEGDIDELRLYTTALTQTEIQNTMFDELVGNETGLAAYYTMNALNGNTLPDDQVDSLHDGTLNGDSVPLAPYLVTSAAFDKPVVSDLSVVTNEDTPVWLTLPGLDKQNEPLTYNYSPTLSLGVLSGTAPNLTYTPNLNANGAETIFTYTVSDAAHTSDVGRIQITVNAVNDAPVANSYSVTTPVNTEVAVPMTGSDVDGPTLSFRLITQPTHGYLSGSRPNYVYTPFAGYEGPDQYTYDAWDGSLASGIATITINVGGAPVLNNAVYLPLLIR